MIRHRTLLLALILLAFALRVYRLDAQSLWYDEGVTVNVAQRSLAELTRWTANDIQPPLYYSLIAGWGRLAGWSEWSLRFPSAWFGVLIVPLLAALLRRGVGTASDVRPVMTLAALHPLLVYYSQEARMYTLLVTLGCLAGYWVLTLAAGGPVWRVTLLYLLTATAAVYTHYFAFFLLLAFGTWFLLATRIKRRALSAFLWANVAIALLYLPWSAILFTRLAVDRSYWQGALKVGETLRSIAISFTTGETMHESIAIWLLLPAAAITVLTLVYWRASRAPVHNSQFTIHQSPFFLFVLLWLLLPITAIVLLAAFAPKFNPRYVLLALPGLLLLWGQGMGSEGRSSHPFTFAPRFSLLTLLLLFAWADWHWFYDRAFTKDQWREVVAFLRPRLEPQEGLVLVSGHAWPVWHYYAPDLPVVRLPAIDVLDVDAVLTFANTAPPLQAAFDASTGIGGTWLISWQDEVVDPTGIIPVQLELGGREKGSSATFWGVTLRRFSQIRPHRIASAPPVSHVVDVEFGGQLRLHGYHRMENGDLLLFWQRLAGIPQLAADYQITGQTFTADGTLLTRIPDQRPAAYEYPVARWREGEIVMGRIPAQQWLGPTPAVGTYTVQLGVYALRGTTTTPLTTPAGQATIDLLVTINEFD
jgi:4-amino-4-deoxy-L-arabinose transferase-like glycosyltransferase